MVQEVSKRFKEGNDYCSRSLYAFISWLGVLERNAPFMALFL